MAEVVRREQAAATVYALVEDEHRGRQTVGISRTRQGGADLRINGVSSRRLSEAAELLPLQVMVPALSDLVFGAPSGRRQWLDWGMFHVEHGYLRMLREYLQAVRQRNALLKGSGSGGGVGGSADQNGLEQLRVWSEEAAERGESVSRSRQRYVDALTPVLSGVLSEMAPELEVEMTYRRGWPDNEPLRKVLGQWGPAEVKSGVTHHGPHRADVSLRVAGLQAGSSLSRGQGKSLASAMMLAQARLLMMDASRASVFLIDDIGAELDLSHGERFFRLLGDLGVQVLATASRLPEAALGLSELGARMFHVEHGAVSSAGRSVDPEQPARERDG
jgi:DNA replication and repair protein RecF